MDRFVPLSKKSKKEQKKFHAMQRRTSCVARAPCTEVDDDIVNVALTQLGNSGGSLTGSSVAGRREWNGARALSHGAESGAVTLKRDCFR